MSAVVICPDGPYPYLEEYFKYCDAQLFPKIINEELLLEKNEVLSFSENTDYQLSCEDAFELLYGTSDSTILSENL